MSNNLLKADLSEMIKEFLINCFKIRKNPTLKNQDNIYNAEKNIRTSIGLFENTDIQITNHAGYSFLTGPRIAFLSYDQQVSKGIYPFLRYSIKSNQDNFQLLYGKSNDNLSDKNWSDSVLAKSSTLKDTNNRLYKEYTINSLEDFESLQDKIIEETIDMINDYHKVFGQELLKTESTNSKTKSFPLNTIYYGPPGTGKTYKARKDIANIIKEQVEHYNQKNINNNQMNFETLKTLKWWEVVCLTMYLMDKNGKYRASQLKKYSQIENYYKEVKNKETITNATIYATLCDRSIRGLEKFRKSPILFDRDDNSDWYLTDNGIKYIEENYQDIIDNCSSKSEVHDDYFFKFITFHPSYNYEDFLEGIKAEVDDETNQVTYEVKNGIFKEICFRAGNNPDYKFFIIIDEINRGNIPKIFGELITLIEDNKRLGNKEPLEITLPYSQKFFGVPNNLHIIGTMNTADRSIALLDIALRRRFTFKEIPSTPSILKITENNKTGIDLEKYLTALNQNIEELYDRDHVIGHSYFMDLEDYPTFIEVIQDKVLPLLQEYFYEDWEKIAQVLGDNLENGEIETNIIKFKKGIIDSNRKLFYINPSLNAENKDELISPEAFKKLYY